jgi:hypothetical protein
VGHHVTRALDNSICKLNFVHYCSCVSVFVCACVCACGVGGLLFVCLCALACACLREEAAI